MSDTVTLRTRQPREEEPISLGQRAAYRRLLAVLKANKLPFVVAGAMGFALHLPHFVDGDLEVYLDPETAPAALAAMSASGFRMKTDEDRGEAHVEYAGYVIRLCWRLPAPLGGTIDEAWFQHAERKHFLGLRVRVAPIEELLWVRVAVPGPASLGDPLIPELLHECGERLDWGRLLSRLAGLEALFLAHVFQFHHTDPDSARRTFPQEILDTLLRRLNAGAGESVEASMH